MFKQQLCIIHMNPPLLLPSLSLLSLSPVFEVLHRADFPCSIQKCDAWGGGGGGVVGDRGSL